MIKPLHPVLQLLTAEPQLAMDHVGFYVEWLGSEVSRASEWWRRRLVLIAMAIASLGVACVLAGVAVMLAASLSTISPSTGWVLVATPLLPLLVALACAVVLRSRPQERIMDQLKLQISQDMLMFREASAP